MPRIIPIGHLFDGLCKMHLFSSPGRQVCISHKATAAADTNWYPCWHFWSSQNLMDVETEQGAVNALSSPGCGGEGVISQ